MMQRLWCKTISYVFLPFHRFRIDNTDHIMDVNKSPAEYDRVNIFCPHRAAAGTSTNDSEGSGNGYYIIYNVSKEEYETCRVTNPAARRMLVCDSPASERRSYVTITFRPFSPQPNGPEFHAGHDYYFICKFKQGTCLSVWHVSSTKFETKLSTGVFLFAKCLSVYHFSDSNVYKRVP